ncbi:hypothetical protein Goarm_006423, partial [Gossypium armourianum]|nr:hypothetical protein [Gossypium armourianum]
MIGCDFNRRKSVEEEKARGYVGILLDLAAFNLRDGYFHLEGFEDAGDFSVTERLKTSVRVNLVFYSVVGSIGLVGLILLILMNRNWFAFYVDGSVGILGLAMALSNTFGLVIDWTIWQKVLSHKIAKMTVKLDEAHQELSNAIVVAQATSNQMSKRDPLRPYMDVIDNMLAQMFREDLSFKPQGGLLGENDMDYDSDEKSMATLRRHLRLAREEYYWYKSEYMTYVIEALQLEDTVKNYERRNSTGWKYVSSFRSCRFGKMGMLLDKMAMGNIDDAVPFLGEGFNHIYPLIMVVYTLLVASNFFDRVVGFFGNWKRLRFQTEADDMDGFDSSGLIILQKERSWLEQGCKVGEQVIPLARNFNGADIESGYDTTDGVKGSPLRPSKEETHKYGTSREAISHKYTVMIKEQGQHVSNQKTVQNNIITESHSANVEAKRFLPLRQNQEVILIVPHLSSSNSESLDEIFQRLKRPSVDHSDEDENENGAEMK